MNLNDYQKQAAVTAQYPEEDGLMYVALGLAGEAGEIANQAKKVIRDDGRVITPARRDAMLKELGDVLWYVAMVAEELGTDLEFVAMYNVRKLERREEEGTIKGDGDDR